MTQAEWMRIVAQMQAVWPQRAIEDDTIAAWYELVKDLDTAAVQEAVSLFARDGREWPPNGGQLRQRALAILDPQNAGPASYAAAQSLAAKAAQLPGGGMGDQAGPWLRENHPLVHETLDQIGWDRWYRSNMDEAVRNKLWRDTYEAVVEQAQQTGQLEQLEAAKREKQLPQEGGKALPNPIKTMTKGGRDGSSSS